MLRSSLGKVLIILLVALIAVYVSLPAEVPITINFNFIHFQKRLKKPLLGFTVGKFSFKSDYKLILGLDLAGGSHLIFKADTENINGDEKKVAMEAVRNVIERRVNFFGVSEPNVYTSSFEGKDRIVVELPGFNDTAQAVQLIGKTAQLIFAEVSDDGEEHISPTDLTGSDLKKASVVFDQTSGKPVVSIEFSDEGAGKFASLTEKNVGKVLPIILDNEFVSAPMVQEKITGGAAQISGDFTLDEAKNLAVQLNAGALPVPVDLVEQKNVGATLGADSVNKSVYAGLVGLVMVMIFMILAYGRFGIIANLALIVFGALTLAIYKLIPIVLTLPGIAGFLLTVGMAVDSNILIFERFKEESKKRDFINAMEISFGRAWDSIRDANIATLIAAVVLANPLDFSFLQTSGPVRGFAITLALGIVISLFTGIIVSRNLIRAFIAFRKYPT